MSTVLSVSFPTTGAKARSIPHLCAPSSMRYYRRSTTTKAPRKRTFLLTMTKYSSELTTPPGVASVFANNVAMLSCGLCHEDMFFGDNGNGCGSNNGGNSNNNNGGSSGGDGHFGGDGAAWRFVPVLSHALLGAVAIVVAVAVFPAQSAAMQGSSPSTSPASTFLGASPKDSLLSSSVPTSRAAGLLADVPCFGRASSPARPRSKVMHVPCKGSTLVVPLTGNGDAKIAAPRLGPWQRAKIVDAPIVLSVNDVAVLDLPQYRVRESLLV
ncbi:hypothetical protein Vafri_5255 [Volvox africanus]|uniref:Uncharacterized protein n=1 Tax=Volvox africanus TaxID=51714 RepID=A0A8J4AVN4_9CHLO|nr:hypothetical protein Vafri_5255 [Volvox africanus]